MQQKKLNKKYIKIFFLVLVIFFTMGAKIQNKPNNVRIHKNIFIEDVDVSKLTRDEAIKEIKKEYRLRNIQVAFGDKTWSIKPDEIDLNFHVEESINEAFYYTRNESKLENIRRIIMLESGKKYIINLKATYNEAKLSEIVYEICNGINIKSKDATFKVLDSGEMKVSKSKSGREVDLSLFKEDIYNMINQKKINRINLCVRTIYPKVNTDDVNSINCILGQYSTSFNNNTSRGSNIHVAGEDSSNILIMPGEVFSYNETTGARTWSKGYKSAPVIVGGKVVNGEGGGVCQVSTTMYNAALLSGMDIEEVHNHTFPSRYTSMGRDAAVSYGYFDLKFKNTYSHPIYIKNIVGDGNVTCSIYGCNKDRPRLYVTTEVKYEKNKYKVNTFRVFLDEENNIMRKELVNSSVYKPH